MDLLTSIQAIFLLPVLGVILEVGRDFGLAAGVAASIPRCYSLVR